MITTPTAFSAPASSQPGSADLKRDQRHPEDDEHGRVAEAPPGAEARRAPGIPAVGRHEGRDRHQVVGVGRVPETEHEGDPERDQKRSPVEQPCEPCIELLDGPEQELEVHQVHYYLLARSQRHPSCGIAFDVIRTPASTIAEAESAGSTPAMRDAKDAPLGAQAGDQAPAEHHGEPDEVSVAARPRLNARIRTIPSPKRCWEIAAIRTTSAEGHGTIPPETPRPIRLRIVIGPSGW